MGKCSPVGWVGPRFVGHRFACGIGGGHLLWAVGWERLGNQVSDRFPTSGGWVGSVVELSVKRGVERGGDVVADGPEGSDDLVGACPEETGGKRERLFASCQVGDPGFTGGQVDEGWATLEAVEVAEGDRFGELDGRAERIAGVVAGVAGEMPDRGLRGGRVPGSTSLGNPGHRDGRTRWASRRLPTRLWWLPMPGLERW